MIATTAAAMRLNTMISMAISGSMIAPHNGEETTAKNDAASSHMFGSMMAISVSIGRTFNRSRLILLSSN